MVDVLSQFSLFFFLFQLILLGSLKYVFYTCHKEITSFNYFFLKCQTRKCQHIRSLFLDRRPCTVHCCLGWSVARQRSLRASDQLSDCGFGRGKAAAGSYASPHSGADGRFCSRFTGNLDIPETASRSSKYCLIEGCCGQLTEWSGVLP